MVSEVAVSGLVFLVRLSPLIFLPRLFMFSLSVVDMSMDLV